MRLVLSGNYWRMMGRWETWRSGGIALRRFHKDKRARKQVRQLLFFIIAPLLLPLSMLLVFTPGGAVGLAIGSYRASRARKKQQEEDARRLAENPPPAPPPPVSPELRKEFAEMALVCAVLVDRAGSENFLKTKVLPEGMEVVTRQRHMEILREYGLYERLGAKELDLMLLPDGHWEAGMLDHVSMQLEPLRLLRWVLQVDGFLPTVGATMQADYRLAGTVVKQPQILFEGTKAVSIEGLRIAINAADQYFFRCWAEGLRRGLYTGEGDDDADRARTYAERMHGKEGDDLLLGTTIVSKAEDADVRLGATLGLRRLRVLGWVKSRMYGEAEPLEKLTQLG